MTASKHTPGPWVWNKWTWLDGAGGKEVLDYAGCGTHECVVSEPDAHLIAAAPELLEALQGEVENAEQRAFEDWLTSTCPIGDSEAVARQWEESCDFKDFCENWKTARAAIAKATGQST